jgi:hypothetical protein
MMECLIDWCGWFSRMVRMAGLRFFRFRVFFLLCLFYWESLYEMRECGMCDEGLFCGKML